jgi:Zn-dependent protease with chaperone function
LTPELEVQMGIGTSLLLIALGAILRFAVHVSAHGFSVHTIGVILIVVGIVGLVLSILAMTVWSRRRERRATVVYRQPPP